MTDVDALLAEYIERYRSGGADPLPFLDRAGGDRLELAALIDAYLERAPRRRVTPGAVRDPAVEQTVDELQRAIAGASGLWPALLPRLRARAGLKRSELVARLAEALGVADQADRVGGYYHRMEQGRLESTGVSTLVLLALGDLVGETAETLRAAGRPLAPPTPPPTSAAYARMAKLDLSDLLPPAAPSPRPPVSQIDDEDELPDVPAPDPAELVDRLFLGEG